MNFLFLLLFAFEFDRKIKIVQFYIILIKGIEKNKNIFSVKDSLSNKNL